MSATLTALALLAYGGCGDSSNGLPPSILVIEAQAIGYSDIGAYGSEIHTPHLDSLASMGLRFTDFYGSLATLTGTEDDSARCDVGLLPELPRSRPAGAAEYRVYRTGSHRAIDPDPQSTVATREALAQLDAHMAISPNAPFLLYVSYLPPLQSMRTRLPEAERYDGRYADGWEVLRRERFARMLALGIIDERYVLPPVEPAALHPDDVPDGESRMEHYAALVERMDADVGRLLSGLRTYGAEGNTLVLFVATSGPLAGNPHENAVPNGWHNATGTPYRRGEGALFEGSLKFPLIAYWPGGIARPGHVSRHLSDARDVVATLLAFAGVHPEDLPMHDRNCSALGSSLEDVFRGTTSARRDTFYWASGSNGAVRWGRWKLVGSTSPRDRWMLFDLGNDPTELRDLAESDPNRLNTLRDAWLEWAYGPRRRSVSVDP